MSILSLDANKMWLARECGLSELDVRQRTLSIESLDKAWALNIRKGILYGLATKELITLRASDFDTEQSGNEQEK